MPMNLVIAADRAGSFDRYVAELMGFPWRRVSHLRNAARLGDLPESLDAIESEFPPEHFRARRFKLRRSLRNWIALSGFKSRFLTWFGYESWFGRVVLHGILYAIVGRPESSRPDSG